MTLAASAVSGGATAVSGSGKAAVSQKHAVIEATTTSVQTTTTAMNAAAAAANDYDARKRDPLHARAELSCMWELNQLRAHFHPSVGHFAKCLLDGESIE